MPVQFTETDRAFFRMILDNPADATSSLVYADYLDDHDQPLKAEFLRLQARGEDQELAGPARSARLQGLRALIDPDWIALFDRPSVENCDREFAFRCPKQWEKLTVTEQPTVRYCDSCNKPVYYSRDINEARNHARLGHCVAVALGVRRYRGDVVEERRHTTVGVLISDRDESSEPTAPERRSLWKRLKFW